MHQAWIPGNDSALFYNRHPEWFIDPRSTDEFKAKLANASREGTPVPEPFLQYPDSSYGQAVGRTNPFVHGYARHLTDRDMALGAYADQDEKSDRQLSFNVTTSRPNQVVERRGILGWVTQCLSRRQRLRPRSVPGLSPGFDIVHFQAR